MKIMLEIFLEFSYEIFEKFFFCLQAYLPTQQRVYSCVHCRAHLASHDQIISKVGYLNQNINYIFDIYYIYLNQNDDKLI